MVVEVGTGTAKCTSDAGKYINDNCPAIPLKKKKIVEEESNNWGQLALPTPIYYSSGYNWLRTQSLFMPLWRT